MLHLTHEAVADTGDVGEFGLGQPIAHAFPAHEFPNGIGPIAPFALAHGPSVQAVESTGIIFGTIVPNMMPLRWSLS